MKIKNKLILILGVLVTINICSCKKSQISQDKQLLDGKNILEKCIKNHGGLLFNTSNIEFVVNDINYEMINYQYMVKYTMKKRIKEDLHFVNYDRGYVKYFINDTLRNNNSYNNLVVNARLEKFLHLLSIPFNLSFNGTIVKRLEDVTIRSKNYYSIHISFHKTEGIPENEFILYIDKINFQMSYLALKYDILESSLSFRRFTNPRIIDGILFQDYISFFPKENSNSTLLDIYKDYNMPKLKSTKPTILKEINVTSITENPFY